MGFGIKTTNIVFSGIFGFSVLAALPVSAVDCDDAVIGLRGDWGQARFNIEIADDPAERAQGLMNRENMPRTSGMLFIYDTPQAVAFWMRNTLIPLDMLFIDPTGVVSTIQENAVPLDETAIPGGENIQYVLEINGGMSELFGITVGSQVLHPRIDQNITVWGCNAQ